MPAHEGCVQRNRLAPRGAHWLRTAHQATHTKQAAQHKHARGRINNNAVAAVPHDDAQSVGAQSGDITATLKSCSQQNPHANCCQLLKRLQQRKQQQQTSLLHCIVRLQHTHTKDTLQQLNQCFQTASSLLGLMVA